MDSVVQAKEEIRPDILKRIVRAKHIFEEGRRAQDGTSTITAAMALLLIHDAVELLMIAILDHRDVPSNERREFMSFWGEMQQATGMAPPDKVRMQALNKARVSLKHHGVMPDPKEVQDFCARVEGFFENSLREFCGIDYQAVSLIDALPDPEARDLIDSASKAFASGQTLLALGQLALAFEKLQEPESRVLPFLQPLTSHDLRQGVRESGSGEAISKIVQHLNLAGEYINALILGIDRIKWIKFWATVPGVIWTPKGEPKLLRDSDEFYRSVTLEDFHECVAFLIEFGIRAGAHYHEAPLRNSSRTYRLGALDEFGVVE